MKSFEIQIKKYNQQIIVTIRSNNNQYKIISIVG